MVSLVANSRFLVMNTLGSERMFICSYHPLHWLNIRNDPFLEDFDSKTLKPWIFFMSGRGRGGEISGTDWDWDTNNQLIWLRSYLFVQRNHFNLSLKCVLIFSINISLSLSLSLSLFRSLGSRFDRMEVTPPLSSLLTQGLTKCSPENLVSHNQRNQKFWARKLNQQITITTGSLTSKMVILR